MRDAHSVDSVREAEGALLARLPDGTLMRRAAAGLASVCARALPAVYGARVVLLVGSGDNGGDALYAGARLAARGAGVRAVPAGSRVHEQGLAALRAAGGRTVDAESAGDEIAAADLVIDGLVGIGGRGGLRDPHARLAAQAGESGRTVVAVDLPSGIDADTGAVAGAAVRADITVTFGTHKPGLLVDPGAEHAGVVELVEIGLAPELRTPALRVPQAGDIAGLLPRLGRETDKYRRGVLGVAAGGPGYVGTAVMTVGAALRTGVGMVQYAGSESVAAGVVRHWPESVVRTVEPTDPVASLPRRVAAWVVGPGRGLHPAAEAELREILGRDTPVLVDADALSLLAGHPELTRDRGAPTLLTPHSGELARLLPGAERAEIDARRLEHAARAAAEYGCTVLLKGSSTVIAAPGEPAIANPTGSALLATAGSGDVLSGLVGALLAGGLSTRDAAMCGAFLHGLAARLAYGGAPVSPSALLDAIPHAMKTVLDAGAT